MKRVPDRMVHPAIRGHGAVPCFVAYIQRGQSQHTGEKWRKQKHTQAPQASENDPLPMPVCSPQSKFDETNDGRVQSLQQQRLAKGLNEKC